MATPAWTHEEARARIVELEAALDLIASVKAPPDTAWTHEEARNWRAREFSELQTVARRALQPTTETGPSPACHGGECSYGSQPTTEEP